MSLPPRSSEAPPSGISRAPPDETVTFAEVRQVLSVYLHALAGRRLQLEAGDDAYTDTETIFLPAAISRFARRDLNWLAFKLLATRLWAQARYGTFNVGAEAVLASYPDPCRAEALFNLLESIRLDAILWRGFPGLAAADIQLHGERALPHPACAPLEAPGATAHDSLRVLAALHAELPLEQLAWLGTLQLGAAKRIRERRVEAEKDALRTALAAHPRPPAAAQAQAATDASAAAGAQPDAAGEPGSETLARSAGFAGATASTEIRRLVASIEQDLGEIPADYLAAPPDDYRPDRTSAAPPSEAAPRAALPGARLFQYDEWDCQRQHYRKHWCTVRELEVVPGDPGFARATLAKYRSQVRRLKRAFEQLHHEDKLLKAQVAGDELDLDALVAGHVELRTGAELPERVFVRRQKAERDVAVLFMVDMSGSTKGWINDAEREALVLLAEAFAVLGDQYAIYGFSGVTRQRCEIYRIKAFDDADGAAMRCRIAGIAPHDFTRMGAAIRHLSAVLQRIPARSRLLVTLSDGKPDDYSDNYRGEYGIEDTRRALREAQRGGIHPFCVTIDREARDYLPRLYGAAHWTLIDDPGRLPVAMAHIYRRLTMH